MDFYESNFVCILPELAPWTRNNMYSKSDIYSQDIKVDQQTLYLSMNITGKSNKNLKDIQTSGAYFILFFYHYLLFPDFPLQIINIYSQTCSNDHL